MWTRRDLMKAGLAGWLTSTLPPGVAAAASGKRPRYFITIFMRGGIDGIYSMDPKRPGEVEPRVSIPYPASAIVDTGAMPFGPHFKQLQKWAPKMAITKGFQVKTANHESGALQVLRMKTAVSRNMPAILDIIGRKRQGQALSSVTLGRASSLEHSPNSLVAPTFGSKRTVLDAMDALSASDFDTMAKAFQAHLKRAEGWAAAGGQREQTQEHLRQTADLFTRLPDVPKFRAQEWSERSKRQDLARDLQRTLWLIENDLAKSVYLKIFFDWDSHFRNASKQAVATRDFTFVFDKFLQELHGRRNAHGKLADNTVIVAGSELGRFPSLNGNEGKDHFPEAPYMCMGPNIRGGQAFGPTGRLMEGQEVSLRTGMPEAGGTHLVLDDIGTTMLEWAGVDPRLHGYRGRRLRFLEG